MSESNMKNDRDNPIIHYVSQPGYDESEMIEIAQP